MGASEGLGLEGFGSLGSMETNGGEGKKGVNGGGEGPRGREIGVLGPRGGAIWRVCRVNGHSGAVQGVVFLPFSSTPFFFLLTWQLRKNEKNKERGKENMKVGSWASTI